PQPKIRVFIYLTQLRQWLCHADARQVCDLPAANLLFRLGLRPTTVIDRSEWAYLTRGAASNFNAGPVRQASPHWARQSRKHQRGTAINSEWAPPLIRSGHSH